MSEHTPKTLREKAEYGNHSDLIWEAQHCAAAWEVDLSRMGGWRKAAEDWREELIVANRSLEAAEKALYDAIFLTPISPQGRVRHDQAIG